MKNSAILLISYPDRGGIVASIADFIFQHNGNFLHADEHADEDELHHTDAQSTTIFQFNLPTRVLAEWMQCMLLKFFWKGQQFARVPGSSRPVNEIPILL